MTVKYSNEHEWIRVEGDVGTIGITNYAQEQLGDVVFVETPDVGKTVKAGDGFAVVESVKAASDVYAPVSGEVVAANAALGDAPETVNAAPEAAGWFAKGGAEGLLCTGGPGGIGVALKSEDGANRPLGPALAAFLEPFGVALPTLATPPVTNSLGLHVGELSVKTS